jgi:hypothetical protein
MEAVRTLRAVRLGTATVSADGLYDLILTATGNETMAAAALKQRVAADLRAGREV